MIWIYLVVAVVALVGFCLFIDCITGDSNGGNGPT